MDTTLCVVAAGDVMDQIVQSAKASGAETSLPQPIAMDGALNADLTFEEARDGLELSILVFKTGSAAARFLKEIRTYLAKAGSKRLVAVNGTTEGRVTGYVSANSTDGEIAELLKQQ